MKMSEQFWQRWRTEYLQELREFHRHQKRSQIPIKVSQIVTVYEDGAPRGLWRLRRVEHVITSPDRRIRSAAVRSSSKTGRCVVIKQPMQHLYPLEVEPQETSSHQNDLARIDTEESSPVRPPGDCVDQQAVEAPTTRPKHVAAMEAWDKILGWMVD